MNEPPTLPLDELGANENPRPASRLRAATRVGGPAPAAIRSHAAANRWRRMRYTVYAPFYDLLANRHPDARRRAVELLGLEPGQRILVVGVGTGQDLPYLPDEVEIVGVDLTTAMLERARARRPGVELRVMDAQHLAIPSASFDAVLLHQVLAVVPDGRAALREAARVLRPGGRISVFDKFFPIGSAPQSASQRGLGRVVDLVFTTPKATFEALLAESGAPLVVRQDEVLGRGGFRILILEKATAT